MITETGTALQAEMQMEEELKIGPTERVDELNGRGYRIIQDKTGFCFGIDAVLLSSFAIVKEGDQVLDLGTGTGVIPILLEAKTRGKRFVGLELQHDVAQMAVRSVAMNHLKEKVFIVEGDIREADRIFKKGEFDVITANPPYMSATGGLVSPNEKKAISRTEIKCTLEDVIRQASGLLDVGGRFYLVHRPQRMSEMFVLMNKYEFAVRYVRLVYPDINKRANLILAEGVKGMRHMPVLEKPCVVYDSEGVYNQEMTDIYFNEKLMEHDV